MGVAAGLSPGPQVRPETVAILLREMALKIVVVARGGATRIAAPLSRNHRRTLIELRRLVEGPRKPFLERATREALLIDVGRVDDLVVVLEGRRRREAEAPAGRRLEKKQPAGRANGFLRFAHRRDRVLVEGGERRLIEWLEYVGLVHHVVARNRIVAREP